MLPCGLGYSRESGLHLTPQAHPRLGLPHPAARSIPPSADGSRGLNYSDSSAEHVHRKREQNPFLKPRREARCRWHTCQSSPAQSSTEEPAAATRQPDRQLELSITGMKDSTCVEKLRHTLLQVKGVHEVTIDVEERQARLQLSPSVRVRQLMDTVRLMNCNYRAVPYREQTWMWRGYRVNYAVAGQGLPIVLVHGFGSNVHHFRKLTADLCEQHTVYAMDLLGFGATEKPEGVAYDPHLWKDQVVDFVNTLVPEPCVLLGNSIGSQVALYAATELKAKVLGVTLLNCSGAMNQKGLYQDDKTLAALRPVFWGLEFLLKRKGIATWLFEKFRSRERVQQVLSISGRAGVNPPYANPGEINDELIDLLCEPAYDTGALDCFVSVFTGDPGPRPEAMAAKLSCPILVAWGLDDPWTPWDGTIAQHFRDLEAAGDRQVTTRPLPQCGHCPMDDCPDAVAEALLPWLAALPRQAASS